MVSDAVVIAIVAALPSTLIGIATLWRVVKTNTAINGRMSEMLDVVRAQSHAQGVRKGKAEERREAERRSATAKERRTVTLRERRTHKRRAESR